MDQDKALQQLLDKQAITEVLFLYCRAIDRKDVELLRSVYHEDAEDYHGVYNGTIDGLLELLRKGRDAPVKTHHSVSNILIELDGDVARTESYLNAVHRREDDTGTWDELLKCRYIDRFERRKGVWKIAKRVVVYDWGTVERATEKAWWDLVGGDFIFGKTDRTDPVYTERG